MAGDLWQWTEGKSANMHMASYFTGGYFWLLYWKPLFSPLRISSHILPLLFLLRPPPSPSSLRLPPSHLPSIFLLFFSSLLFSLCLSPIPQVLPETVIGVWKGGDDWPSEMFNITKAGLKTVLSACWYLDLISYGQDWQNVSRRIVVLELSCKPASSW